MLRACCVCVTALGLLAGPIIAAMYSSCSEVLCGQYVPELFTLFRTGLGLGALLGPTIAGKEKVLRAS
jgi:hypothetical protein